MSVNVEPVAGAWTSSDRHAAVSRIDAPEPDWFSNAALGIHGQTHLISKSLEPVASDSGIAIVPTTTYDECPCELDVLFVPGGMGTPDVMEDLDTLRFLEERANTASYLTSVCAPVSDSRR